MRTIINHQGRFILRREDFLGITGNDDCCSQLLAIFEYWTICRLEEIDRVEAFNQSSARGDGRLMKRLDLWLYERVKDFGTGILSGYGSEAIKKALKKLESWGFISTKPSPHPWDRTKMYRFNIEAVNQAIATWWKSLKALKTGEDENALGGNQSVFGENGTALGENGSVVSPYIKSQNNIQSINHSPPTPPGGDAGEQALPVEEVKAELVVEHPQPSQPQTQSSCVQPQTESQPNQPTQQLGQTSPAERESEKLHGRVPRLVQTFQENDSRILDSQLLDAYESLEGQIDYRNGKPYKPWMVLLGQDRRMDINPDFLKFVAKQNFQKPYFKEMQASRLPRETKNWIRRHEEEALELWEEFKNPRESALGNKTVAELESKFNNEQRNQRLKSAGFDWDSYIQNKFGFKPSEFFA